MKRLKIVQIFLCSILFSLPLSAKVLISPIDVMKQTYGKNLNIVKKNILLTASQTKLVEAEAKLKVKSRIFRIYKAQKGSETVGYGVLVNRKVRSKNTVVLYLISKKSILESIEVIAFNEPMEYLPSDEWNSQFENISTSKMLKLSKDIPTVTGATMSARAITDGSRLAFAIYNKVLKDK